jgi:hypothetical protein
VFNAETLCEAWGSRTLGYIRAHSLIRLRITEASTKKNEPVRARANFLVWLGIDSFLLAIFSAAIT